MAETSVPWTGTAVGDAGPYTSELWTDLWNAFFAGDNTVKGIFQNVLNGLTVTGAVSPVAVDTGYAFVDGTFYKNSASVNVAISTPAVSTRIDRIVLQKNWAAQTVRIARLVGAEGGAEPALTQSDGNIWEIPLAKVTITTLGAITLADERSFISVGGGGSPFWTTASGVPVRTGNTTFTVTGDYTNIFRKGLVIVWKEAGVTKWGMVSIPSTYGAPDTTVTIIGDTMASIDASSLKYAAVGAEVFAWSFAIAGTIGATGTDVANARYAAEPMKVLGADIQVGTAGTTNNTTVDANKGGATMFTTKPTLASTVASSPTPFTADSGTTLALGDKVTIDQDAVQTTPAVDEYVQLYVYPLRYEFLI